MNKFHLALIACACWAASMSLAFFGTFKMASIVRDADSIAARTNDTSIVGDLNKLRNDVYYASRVEGLGTDAIFAVICLYIFLCSFPYFIDWSSRFFGFCGHKSFWAGLALDITGFSLCFNGFAQYGGHNPQNGTAFISSGMSCVAVGSYLIIRRYEISQNEPLDVYRDASEGNAPGYNSNARVPAYNPQNVV